MVRVTIVREVRIGDEENERRRVNVLYCDGGEMGDEWTRS